MFFTSTRVGCGAAFKREGGWERARGREIEIEMEMEIEIEREIKMKIYIETKLEAVAEGWNASPLFTPFRATFQSLSPCRRKT